MDVEGWISYDCWQLAGYGDVLEVRCREVGHKVPARSLERHIRKVLMLLGITLFAGITASITSYFVTQGQGGGMAHSSIAEELRGLADLRGDGALT